MSLYDVLFEMAHELCRTYPALTPFIIRKTSVHEVFLLVRRLRRLRESEKKAAPIKKSEEPKRVEVNEFTATGGWY